MNEKNTIKEPLGWSWILFELNVFCSYMVFLYLHRDCYLYIAEKHIRNKLGVLNHNKNNKCQYFLPQLVVSVSFSGSDNIKERSDHTFYPFSKALLGQLFPFFSKNFFKLVEFSKGWRPSNRHLSVYHKCSMGLRSGLLFHHFDIIFNQRSWHYSSNMRPGIIVL